LRLTTVDWSIIAAYFLFNILIGFYYKAKAGSNTTEFFLSGRNVPWWLAGTSMVATTFSADTPLVVTGLVYTQGIAGNWLWWNMAASGILTVFFFAALWRRSGVLTDVEFIELRYGGAPASALRGVRAVYQGVIVNTIIMGWVNLAMVKILSLTLHVPTYLALWVCLALTALYVTIGGFWSVLVTDLLQFVVKMSMAIVLAVAAVAAVGGIAYGIVITSKAHQFATQGLQTYPEADNLLRTGPVAVLQYGGLIGSLLLAVSFVLIALNAMRVGLLTKFSGYIGMAAAAASLLLVGSAPALLIEVFWLLSTALLLAGRWPSGDPPAWKTGQAVPWPSSAELREQRLAARGQGRQAPKRDGRRPAPVPAGTGSSPTSTRSTAAKRKRKRRK